MPKNSPEFTFFLEALETFENLLHAETQAIAAKHLETIEEIIERKDENLRALLEAKERVGMDPRSISEAKIGGSSPRPSGKKRRIFGGFFKNNSN